MARRRSRNAAAGVTSGGRVTSLLSAECSYEIRAELTIPSMVQAARVARLQCHESAEPLDDRPRHPYGAPGLVGFE
jgi:hypothetical protein